MTLLRVMQEMQAVRTGVDNDWLTLQEGRCMIEQDERVGGRKKRGRVEGGGAGRRRNSRGDSLRIQ